MTETDIYLDAAALVTAQHHRDEDGFNAVLAAADGCPWYLAQLVEALAELGALALESHPGDVVDGFLTELRRQALEWG